MKKTISAEFTFIKLLKFTLPSMIMMIFLSLYTIVDGFFVARFVGTNALSAINIVYPLISLFVAIGIMFSAGGSAFVAKKLGENKKDEASKDFSLIILSGFIFSVILSVISIIFIDPIIITLGANEEIFKYCKDYLIILLIFAPLSVLQMEFEYFFITAGKPGISLLLGIFAGLTNMILDYIFIVPLNMGIAGAAYATAASYCIPAIGGLIYFSRKSGWLYFSSFKFNLNVILKSASNGSSEMVSNLAASVITFIFNILMMKFAGPDGVAAITVILYIQFVMTALYLGFSRGVTPIISYNLGMRNFIYMRKLLKMCWIFIFISSVSVFIFAEAMSHFTAAIFASGNESVFKLTKQGMNIFSISFLFAGINIFASALFTALSDGKNSAIISFARTFIFTIAGIFIMTHFFGILGIWLSVPIAEALTIILSVFLMSKYLKQTIE